MLRSPAAASQDMQVVTAHGVSQIDTWREVGRSLALLHLRTSCRERVHALLVARVLLRLLQRPPWRV